MKAKLISLNEKHELHLENGKVFTSNEGEKKAAFQKRIQKEVELDLGELEITEITSANFKTNNLDQLRIAKTKQKGLLLELIKIAIDEKVAEEKDAAKKAKEEAAAKKTEEKEAKAKAREEAKASKPTLEAVQAQAADHKQHVGKKVTFKPNNIATNVEGVINGIWVDKRVPMALMRIFDEDGKMYNKVLGSADITIGEMAPDPKAEAKALKLKEKEEAAAKKAENKIAADKAKAEAKEAKEKEKVEAATKKAEEKAAKDAEALTLKLSKETADKVETAKKEEAAAKKAAKADAAKG